MRWISRQLGAFVASALGAATAAQGSNIAWSNIQGGNFSSTVNWLGDVVPGTADVALFSTGAPGSYETTFASSVTNSQLFVTDNVTFDLGGKTYTLSDPVYETGVYSADIGSALGGTLSLQNSGTNAGTFSTVYAAVGALLGDTGTVNISGALTTWADSKTLYVGDAGNGTLTIKSASSVSDLAGSVGNAATGVGNVTVDGAGSTWNNSDYLYIGAYGSGALTIQNGGHVSGAASYIGQYGTGSVTVTGTGSNWNPTYIDLAYKNAGSLTIANGASVSDADVYISCAADAPATVNVSGAGTSWTSSDTMYVGMDSATTFNISGGLVSVAKTFGIANKPGTQVNLSGGTLSVGSLNTSGNPALLLGNGVSTGWTGGTLNITASDLPVSSTGPLGANLSIGNGKSLQVSGSSNTLSIAAGSTLNAAGGSVYASSLNNAGTLSLPAGSSVEVANPLTNTGLIDVSGGTLQLDNGVSSGSVRTQILSAYDHGEWDGTTGITSTAAENDSTHATALAYITTGSITKIMYTWYGDIYGTGTVTPADAAAMSSSGTTWQTGDFNYDGVVNADDFSLFWVGAIYGSASIITKVPEPAALAVLLPLLGMAARRRR